MNILSSGADVLTPKLTPPKPETLNPKNYGLRKPQATRKVLLKPCTIKGAGRRSGRLGLPHHAQRVASGRRGDRVSGLFGLGFRVLVTVPFRVPKGFYKIEGLGFGI